MIKQPVVKKPVEMLLLVLVATLAMPLVLLWLVLCGAVIVAAVVRHQLREGKRSES